MAHSTTHFIKCKLTIKHYNSFTKSSKAFDLVIFNDNVTTKKADSSIQEDEDKEGLEQEMNFSIGDIEFNRKIYQPNEIKVTVKIKPYIDKTGTKTNGKLPDLDTIRKMFLNKPAELVLGFGTDKSAKVVRTIKAIGYYVYDIKPRYKQNSASTEVEVALTIKSLDNLMTLNKYSQAYLARKFKGEILASVDRFKLSYPTNQKLTDIQQNESTLRLNPGLNLQHLFYGNDTSQKEFIQPYLVQYNESFYDFIVRVANRCGEFLYFENGALCVGLNLSPDPIKKTANTVTYTDLSAADYSEVVFQSISDLSPLDIKDYARDSLKDKFEGFKDSTGKDKAAPKSNFSTIEPKEKYGKKIYKDFGREEELIFPSDTELGKKPDAKSSYDNYYYNSEISSDEYYMPLYKEGWGSSIFREKMAEVNRGSAEKHKAHVVATVLAATNLLDLVWDLAAEYIELAIITHVYGDEKNKRGFERFIEPYSVTLESNEKGGKDFNPDVKYVVPFSEDVKERWTTLDYYSDIKKKEEYLQHQSVEITFETNLFKDIKLGEIIRLKDISTTTLYVVTEVNIKYDAKSIEIVKAIPLLLEGKEYSAYPPVIEGEIFRYSGPQTAFVVDAADPKHQGRVRIRYPWQTNADVIPTENIVTPDSKTETDPEKKKQYEKIEGIIEKYKNEKIEAATPWIRMSVPSSSNSGGIYFEPEPGDEVIVNFENGNVERPYVVGALYSKNNTAPVGKGRRVIKSKFGHTIRFKDPSDGVGEITDSVGKQRVLGSLVPITDMISLWSKNDLMEGDEYDPLTGGIDMGDQYGIYNISMSSDERAIKISSPFGDVNLNAFTGITISAPNGDIKITGKNVEISASNKLDITSGGNLSRDTWYKSLFLGDIESGEDLASKFINEVTDRYSPVNLGLIRSVLEIIVRPIDGTLKLKSHGFVKIEAGEGEAEVPKDNYTPFYKNHWLKQKYSDNITPQTLSDLSVILNGYLNQIIEVVNVRAKKEIRNQIIEVRNHIKAFEDSYIKSGVLKNINNVDELIDRMYQTSFKPFEFKEISFPWRAKYLVDNTFHIETNSPINKDFKQLWNDINLPQGLKNAVTANALSAISDFTPNQQIKDNLITDIKHAFVNKKYLFGRIDKFQNANEAKTLLNPANPLEDIGIWNIDATNLMRSLADRMLTQSFFKANFPEYQLKFKNPDSTDDTQDWLNAVKGLSITVTPLPDPSGWSKLGNFIVKNFLTNIKDFVGGLIIWKDGRAVNGKILMSEKKNTTIRLNDQGALVQHHNRDQEIEDTVAQITNEIKAKLHF